ncbi:hypothetical protein V1514DRAFT_326044 [Lipomyces japonicus]|uniref:uncharacterized protein n=1 Tax=Lipomyces japonicus TaxID=56871 RepID=UPI0034CF3C6E
MSDYTPPTSPLKFKSTQGTPILSKPFKSPLKRQRSGDDGNDRSSGGTLLDMDSSPIKRLMFTSVFDKHKYSAASDSHVGKFREKFLAGLQERTTVDPVLLKQETALNLSIRQVRQKIAQSEQAFKYENSKITLPDGQQISEDDHLMILINKWRNAAQSAASFLFELAAQRVMKMGGVAEFKKRTRRRGFDDEDDEQQDRDANGINGARDEYDYDVTSDSIQTTSRADTDEEFTMEMMLGTLNIDPTIVFPT